MSLSAAKRLKVRRENAVLFKRSFLKIHKQEFDKTYTWFAAKFA